MNYITGMWRRKPIPVHVEQFIAGEHKPAAVYWYIAENTSDYPTGYYIDTLEGQMAVKNRAVIITGVEGEQWAVQESVFLKTYEPVEE